MPSNPELVRMRARLAIETKVFRLPEQGVVFDVFVWDIIRSHPVSERWVEKTVERFFVKKGYARVVDEMLMPPKKQEAVE